MSKAVKLISCLFLLSCAHPFLASDFELMFSVPSLCGLVCGNNALLNETEDFEDVAGSFNYSLQSFGKIHSFKNDITLAWSGGANFYTQTFKTSDARAFQFGLTGGLGVFFNYWSSFRQGLWQTLPLTGLSAFFYPVYEFPVIRVRGNPYWVWKSALELGVNYTIGYFSLYPYLRAMAMFSPKSANPGVAMDFGVLLGFYF